MPTRTTKKKTSRQPARQEPVADGFIRVRWLLSAVGRRAGQTEVLHEQWALPWIRARLLEPVGPDKAQIRKRARAWKSMGPIPWLALQSNRSTMQPVLETPRRDLSKAQHQHWETEFGWRCASLKHGNLGALYDALCLAAERDQDRFDTEWRFPAGFKGRVKHPLSEDHWIEIPRWVWYGAVQITADWLRTARSSATGQTASWLKRRRQDMIDWTRWRVVKQLHEEGRTFHPSRRQLHTIFELAAKRLKGTTHACAAGTVERSYDRVERVQKSDPGRYRELSQVRPQPGKGRARGHR